MNFLSEDVAPTILISIAGGISKWLTSDDHTWWSMLVSVFLAAFTGYLVGLYCMEKGYSESITAMACGIAGMSSESVLKLIQCFVLKTLPIFIDKNKGEDK